MFLKYLDDLEKVKATASELSGKTYTNIHALEFQWTVWVTPKDKDDNLDHHKCIETRVEELDQEKLPCLLTNNYQSLEDAKSILGHAANINRIFIEFQEHLYKQSAM